MTRVPWSQERALLWDVTVVNTLAQSQGVFIVALTVYVNKKLTDPSIWKILTVLTAFRQFGQD